MKNEAVEIWRAGSPLYSDGKNKRLTAYHDINGDLFTVGMSTMDRKEFIRRYGEPGMTVDIIRWKAPGGMGSRNVYKTHQKFNDW